MLWSEPLRLCSNCAETFRLCESQHVCVKTTTHTEGRERLIRAFKASGKSVGYRLHLVSCVGKMCQLFRRVPSGGGERRFCFPPLPPRWCRLWLVREPTSSAGAPSPFLCAERARSRPSRTARHPGSSRCCADQRGGRKTSPQEKGRQLRFFLWSRTVVQASLLHNDDLIAVSLGETYQGLSPGNNPPPRCAADAAGPH